MVKTVEERQTRYEEQIEQRLARLVEFAAANHDNQHRRTTEDLRKAFSPAKPVPATSRQPKGRQTRLHHYFNTRTSKESPLWHIPTDILLEIASHLTHPLDLLHYSWTSTVARGTLMSRRHRSIWQVVLRRVPDLPPRPEDLSEPLYTALVFGQHCFVRRLSSELHNFFD
ncbi:hypothetical protein L227DRAFT_190832 [Lentinus tigrinus ALCF2SS1-6]|uniref:F-box domain-containing protein n=1 Tax=Lentinus tigrinus ALCF2SS1-6 TaxID=1328759 RepID=A0A5C2S3I9_9APHY|nr:hypothetical protein L227DRAFT_190832 [Lentinus tigrinus ALCF2SS1-6]